MLVAFSITPIGVGEDVAEYVADAVRVVRESGLPNRTDAMFTTVEGDWDEVMDVVRRAVDAVAAKAPQSRPVAQGRPAAGRDRRARFQGGGGRAPPRRVRRAQMGLSGWWKSHSSSAATDSQSSPRPASASIPWARAASAAAAA